MNMNMNIDIPVTEESDFLAQFVGGHTSELAKAVYANDAEHVGRLLSQGSDPNLKNTVNGNSLLHFAARHSCLGIIQCLIAKAADLEIRNHTGLPPVVGAVHEDRLDVLRLFMDKGARLDWVCLRDGNSFLHASIEGNASACTMALIEAGLDLNRRGYNTITPLEKLKGSSIEPVIRSFLLKRSAESALDMVHGEALISTSTLTSTPIPQSRLNKFSGAP